MCVCVCVVCGYVCVCLCVGVWVCLYIFHLLDCVSVCFVHLISYMYTHYLFTHFHRNFDQLIPDAPELVHSYLEGEQDASCKRNAFMMLIHVDRVRDSDGLASWLFLLLFSMHELFFLPPPSSLPPFFPSSLPPSIPPLSSLLSPPSFPLSLSPSLPLSLSPLSSLLPPSLHP